MIHVCITISGSFQDDKVNWREATREGALGYKRYVASSQKTKLTTCRSANSNVGGAKTAYAPSSDAHIFEAQPNKIWMQSRDHFPYHIFLILLTWHWVLWICNTYWCNEYTLMFIKCLYCVIPNVRACASALPCVNNIPHRECIAIWI